MYLNVSNVSIPLEEIDIAKTVVQFTDKYDKAYFHVKSERIDLSGNIQYVGKCTVTEFPVYSKITSLRNLASDYASRHDIKTF
jgi:hypothetical protein